MKLSKPELSQKNPYWIEKHRYYELKHFCLQYNIWKQAYYSLDGLSRRPFDLDKFGTNDIGDPTFRCAMAKEYYLERMEMVEEAAKATDDDLYDYIFSAVTNGLSYETLVSREQIPCCKDVYYKLYRKFFWVLNKLRK